MKAFKRYIGYVIVAVFALFVGAFVSACTDNKAVSSYEQDKDTHEFRITFNEPIIDADKAGPIHTTDETEKIFSINGKAVGAE